MPVTASAKKARRRDKRRTIINSRVKTELKEILKQARKKATKETIKKAYSMLDKAAQKNVIHKNKAARIKSRLAKLSHIAKK